MIALLARFASRGRGLFSSEAYVANQARLARHEHCPVSCIAEDVTERAELCGETGPSNAVRHRLTTRAHLGHAATIVRVGTRP